MPSPLISRGGGQKPLNGSERTNQNQPPPTPRMVGQSSHECFWTAAAISLQPEGKKSLWIGSLECRGQDMRRSHVPTYDTKQGLGSQAVPRHQGRPWGWRSGASAAHAGKLQAAVEGGGDDARPGKPNHVPVRLPCPLPTGQRGNGRVEGFERPASQAHGGAPAHNPTPPTTH